MTLYRPSEGRPLDVRREALRDNEADAAYDLEDQFSLATGSVTDLVLLTLRILRRDLRELVSSI